MSAEDIRADGARTEREGSHDGAVADRPRRAGRSRLVGGLTLLFLLAGAAALVYWVFVLRFEESTDNAYVAGNLVRVSPQVAGTVAAIFADNTDFVRAGQVVVSLDRADAELAFRRARSSLADAVRQTRSLMAESERLASLVQLRTRELERARGDYERRRDRKTAMAVSEEELSHARDNLAIAGHALRVAQDDMRRNQLLLQDTPLEEQPAVKREAQLLREAWLALQRCEVRSPVDGFAARRSAQVGMSVSPGTPLMAVVPLHEVWVDANFKEGQLRDMRLGQPVNIRVDMYGSSVRYRGEVAGFSAGTGSSFSLLPPENATGNWIKVVQRVPVKIVLNREDVEKHPLLVGLSCLVEVDVSETGGPMLAQPLPGTPEEPAPVFATSALEYDQAEIDREIAAIIRANAALDEEKSFHQ